MFYVIRDDYNRYDYKIVSASFSMSEAFDRMCMDIGKYLADNGIEIEVPKLSTWEHYYEDGLQIWEDGALIDGTCRWGITYWEGDK